MLRTDHCQTWARILVQAANYRRLRIGRDGHLDQSEAYDIRIYLNVYESASPEDYTPT